jgi:serine/threonine-protein kinase
MGVVYRAQHDIIERAVAVKVLSATCLRVPGIRERFFREARIANRLQHPAVIDVLDLGETEEGLLYLVMEYLLGETLFERFRRSPLPLRDLLEVVRAVCWALGAAHDIGIVHRDVTPSNVFLVRRAGTTAAQVKVLDFGIAFIKNEIRITVPGQMVGTPSYMAPEAVLGREITSATDVYSLGVVLYEGLTGRLPFDGPSFAIVAAKHVGDPPPPLHEHAPQAPERLAALVMRCLAKDPEGRPATMQEIGDELSALLRDLPAPRPEAPPPAGVFVPPVTPQQVVRAAVSQAAGSGIEAWKEFLARARAWARKENTAAAALRVGELEFALTGLVSAEKEIDGRLAQIEETQSRFEAARERFDRALDALRGEEALLEERVKGLRAALEAASSRRAEAEGAFAEARRPVREGEEAERNGRPSPRPAGSLVRAYRAAGEAARLCDEAAAAEQAALEAAKQGEDELQDVRFQIDQLASNSVRATAPLSEKLDSLQRDIGSFDERRAELYRKLIEAAGALTV